MGAKSPLSQRFEDAGHLHRGPLGLAHGRGYALGRKGAGQSAKALHPRCLKVRDDGGVIGRLALSLSLARSYAGRPALVSCSAREMVPSDSPELLGLPLSLQGRTLVIVKARVPCGLRGKSSLGAARDGLAFSLSDGRHDMDDQLIRLGHVSSAEAHPGFLKAREEVKVTGQAVQFGNDQRSIVKAAQGMASASFGRSLFFPLSTSTTSFTTVESSPSR